MRTAALMLILLLAGCAGRPGPAVAPEEPAEEAEAPAPETTTEESSAPDEDVYRLESEGTAPPQDVRFEEDRLPPAPEEVEGASLTEPGIQPETVPEDLPPVEGEASVTAPVEPSVETPVPPQPAVVSRGFRVQIHAGTERPAAEDVARQARTRVPEPVYVVSEGGYYKVRVGDFHDRALALRLRDRLRSYGYPEAWVVTTEVRAKGGDSAP